MIVKKIIKINKKLCHKTMQSMHTIITFSLFGQLCIVDVVVAGFFHLISNLSFKVETPKLW